MRLTFISFHFRPSNEIGARRPTAISEALASRGVETTVISTFNGAGAGPRSTLSNLHFIVVPEPRKLLLPALVRIKSAIFWWRRRPAASSRIHPDQRPFHLDENQVTGSNPAGRGLASRLVSLLGTIDVYKMWSWRASQAGASLPADIVCSSGPPMTCHLAALRISVSRGIPLVVDLRDPWVTGVQEGRRPHGIPLLLSRHFERRVLQHATAITVTADHLAELLAATYPGLKPRIHVIRNGFDGDIRSPMRSTGGRLSMLFAGELYAHRKPFTFLEALERLLTRSDVDGTKIDLSFIGDCEVCGDVRLRDWLRGKRCDDITRVLPSIPTIELEGHIDRATLLLNFAQASPTTIPAKSYDHMASGREILILCEGGSATARLMGGISGVALVDPGDAFQMDEALLDIYRRHVTDGVPRVPDPRKAAEFSRAQQGELFVRLIESLGTTTQ